MDIIGRISIILCCLLISEGKISEYQVESEILSRCELSRADGSAQQKRHVPQCSEDGRFRHVQCTQESEECWCVDAEGSEIPGSRRNGSAVHCLTSCQLQRQRALTSEDAPFVPLCLESGEYQPIQCLPKQEQCWCVDQEGMEIYGTRQKGKPSRCPGSCLIRERRLLHGVGQSSPPQCSADGNFLPVQCKFVNTTDMMVLDLLHTFNRFPEAFQTFSGFREAFPEVSSYCFCADSRGRELASTGVELLLDEVYDTAFSGMGPGRSFSQSNMYRILQRRFLGIQLAMSGRFRCPTKCERERASSTEARNVHVPSCDESGSYASVQCQAGGQCWCADSDGREIFGTRLQGERPVCSREAAECPSERRLALSRLFFGLSSSAGSQNVFAQRDQDLSPLSPCSPEVQELLGKSGVLSSISESGRSDLSKVLAEVIQGMFPTGALALKAISLTTNPKRLQENLFGGKFLKNAGNFNFSAAVGPRGTFSFGRVFSQVGLAEVSADLAQLAKVFSPEANSGFEATTLDQEVTDPLHRLVNLKKNSDLVKLVGATLESEQFLTALREVITLMKAEDSEDLGGVFSSVFQSSQPGVCQRDSSALYVPQCTETGQYQQVQCHGPDCWCVDSRGVEVPGSRSTGRRPRCPSQCESERVMAVKVRAGLSAGSEVFIPKCKEDGSFAPLQCSGKDCFCMDREGSKRKATMGRGGLQCPSDCQASAAGRFLSAVRLVLSDPSETVQISDVYVPQCDPDGGWRQVQCDGPPEQAFQFYRDWVRLNNAGQDMSVTELMNILKGYGKNPEALSFEGFLKLLFDAGHHRVFPVLSRFESFDSVPAEILAGSGDAFFGPTVFHNPLLLWKLLRGSLTQYPGQLSDFSAPLGHFNLRQCWCVGAHGDMIANTKASVDQIPKCPGSCALAERQASQFRQFGLSISVSQSDKESLPLGFQPYSPQCDSNGQWLPTQCDPSTGHCWCVDGDGQYIPESLTSRSMEPPQCGTPCQRARSQSLLSDWMPATSVQSDSSYNPTCEEDGEFSVLQRERGDSGFGWCVSRVTGKAIQPAVLSPSGDYQCPSWCQLQKEQAMGRTAGIGYVPECMADGQGFSPMQCDHGDCWCVSPKGKELPGTRISRSTGQAPACESASDCQRSGLGCTESGEFTASHQDREMGKWMCLNSKGERLLWTSSVEPLSESECKVMEKFEDVPRSQWLLGSDAVLLASRHSDDPMETQLKKCVSDCAVNESCHHLALFADGGQAHCEVYSTDGANIECKTSEKTKGFLGNPGADMYRSLSCLLKVKGDRPDLVVLRKKGFEFTTASLKTFEKLKFRKAGSGVYRTTVFQAQGATLTDVHRLCQDTCSQESCCDGFILNQNILNGGTIMCGLLSFPDLLLCSDEDWDIAGTSESNRICGAGVQYNKQKKQFTFNFGGQNFNITDKALPASSKNKTDYQASIIGFQRIYLWKDSDLTTRQKTSPECVSISAQPAQKVLISDEVKDGFTALDSASFRVNPTQSVPSQQYWIFKHQSTAEEAQLWCLKRCEEEDHCHVADLRDENPTYFTCVLYPNTQVCGAYDTPLRNPCSLVLPEPPQNAHSKIVTLLGSVKSFYSRVPFKKMVSYSVRSRVSLGAKPITEGFFECERRCDEDPCCRGIGYVRDSQSPGTDVLCLTLNSFGIQTCGEEDQTGWRAMDCTPSKVQTGVFPYGWYEKPVNQWTRSPDLCPPFTLPTPSQNVRLSDWALLDSFSILVDPSISNFDVIHISKDIAEDLEKPRDWCLSACEKKDSCSVVTVDRRDSAVRCVLYPDTTAQGQSSHLLVREPASLVYFRKGLKSELKSVVIPGHGTLVGESRVVMVGSERKTVSHFLGVPYARPPVGELRFSPPQSAEWSGTWNATVPRSNCLLPGDGDSSLSNEDCLYLNVFVPASNRGDSPVLVFLYNSASPAMGDSLSLLDGSYFAAAGNVIVVTAQFRSSVFGFLSTASLRNAGLQDQVAVLKWVQQNIAHFGGNPGQVTLGAERSGADVASLHLLSDGATGLFHRALLMGGSAFSPASIISKSRARELTDSLVSEVGCSSTDPAQVVSCLKGIPATSLNSAQTKLLAVSGPLQAWAPVVDGISVKRKPSPVLQRTQPRDVDIILGSSAEDGLISRAKNIKKFEELQGRADGKTAFYEALSNSLGGDRANSFVKEAATWFYSMQHSPTPAGYNVFSRALENATRDLFIVCPAVQMARFWAAQQKSNVFMYHLPEKMAQTSADLSMPLDLQYVFGVPHHTRTRSLFTSNERTLSQRMMAYVANFIKSGNPNHPLSSTRASFSDTLPPWPRYLPSPEGDNYKELDMSLSNRKGLKRAECSFWSDYVPQLTASTAKLSPEHSADETDGFGAPTQETKLPNFFQTLVTQSKQKSGKDAYN